MPAIREVDLERRARGLEGQTLARVWYHQSSDHAYAGDGWHSVDTAVLLETESGQRFAIAWADEFGLHHGFGISIKPTPSLKRDDGFLQDVTADPAWRPFIGCPLGASRIIWCNVIENMRAALVPFCGIGHITRIDYPQALEITCGPAQLVFSATKMREDGTAIPFTNHLTVFFDRATYDRCDRPLRKW